MADRPTALWSNSEKDVSPYGHREPFHEESWTVRWLGFIFLVQCLNLVFRISVCLTNPFDNSRTIYIDHPMVLAPPPS